MSFGAASFPEDGQDAACPDRHRRRQPLRVQALGRRYGHRAARSRSVARRSIPGLSAPWTHSSAPWTTRTTTRGGTPLRWPSTRAPSAKASASSEEQQETLRVASLLHDVGKIGVPDRILRKPGTLTPKEAGVHAAAPAHRQHDDHRSICRRAWTSRTPWPPTTNAGTARATRPSCAAADIPLLARDHGRGRRLLGHDHRPAVPRAPSIRRKPWTGSWRAAARSSTRRGQDVRDVPPAEHLGRDRELPSAPPLGARRRPPYCALLRRFRVLSMA